MHERARTTGDPWGRPRRPESTQVARRGRLRHLRTNKLDRGGRSRGSRDRVGTIFCRFGVDLGRAKCLKRRQDRVAEHFSQICLFLLLMPTWGRFCLSQGPSGEPSGPLWALFWRPWSLIVSQRRPLGRLRPLLERFLALLGDTRDPDGSWDALGSDFGPIFA